MSELRRLRLEHGLSIAELAEQAGLSDDQVRSIEMGRVKVPRVNTLRKLGAVLNVTPVELDRLLSDREAA